MNYMEKNYTIRLDSAHTVYGKFSGSIKRPLVIVVHGLLCSMNEGIYERACEWFAGIGFATYRFNLYSWQSDARQLIDCTLSVHAQDLDHIVDHFRKKGFKKIFVIGHSLAGPAIFLSKNQAFDAAVFWDPSYGVSYTQKRYGIPGGRFVKACGGYLMRWGINPILGKQFVEEIDGLDWARLSESFYVPLKIIAAEKGVLVPGSRTYLKHVQSDKQLLIMKGATHYFDDTSQMRERLFAATYKWFMNY